MADLLDERAYVMEGPTGHLLISQDDVPDGLPGTDTFAASAPGGVILAADGTRGVRVTLQRWTARPPVEDERWTARDELPWQEVVGAGPLTLRQSDTDRMDVTGLGRARVRVLRSHDRAGEGPTEWLLQFFPDPERLDAMAGEPRVLATAVESGEAGSDVGGTTAQGNESERYWHGLSQLNAGGWRAVRYAGIDTLLTLLGVSDVLMTMNELEQLMTQFGQICPVDSWDDIVFVPHSATPDGRLEKFAESPDELVAALEVSAGIPLRTLADSLEVLVRLGALMRVEGADGEVRIAPSVTPPAIWDAVALPPGWRLTLRAAVLMNVYGPKGGDLLHLLRWAPSGVLRASLRDIAVRLATEPEDVRDRLAVLSMGQVVVPPELAMIDVETPFETRKIEWREATEIVQSKVLAYDHDVLVGMLEEFLEPTEAEAWLVHERPSARLVPAPPGERPTAILGGLPSLPDDVAWPTWGDVPLSFLAAVDLAAVSDVLPDLGLPSAGWLNFFATGDESPAEAPVPFVSAMFPASRGGWHVAFVPADATVSVRPSPAAHAEHVYPRVDKVLTPEATLPEPYAFSRGRGLQFDSERLSGLRQEMWRRHELRSRSNHRIGGWPDPTQSDPAAPVALADAGLIGADGSVDYRHPDAPMIVQTADDDWVLLLQLDSDGDTGWMWGDGGVMFFYVKVEDARRGDFTNVWMNWDCH